MAWEPQGWMTKFVPREPHQPTLVYDATIPVEATMDLSFE